MEPSRYAPNSEEEEIARQEAEEKAHEAAETAFEESLGHGTGGGKGKKGKAAEAAKVKPSVAYLQQDAGDNKSKACKGGGPYKCASPGAGNKLIEEKNKAREEKEQEAIENALVEAAAEALHEREEPDGGSY